MEKRKVTARLNIAKGSEENKDQLMEYHRMGNSSSPIDIIQKWGNTTTTHEIFFEIAREPLQWPRKGLPQSMENVLCELYIDARPHSKLASNSLRIEAQPQYVLLGIPLKVRLAPFGWGTKRKMTVWKF